MIEITQEILNRIHTDSDVYELAEELGISHKELDFAIENKYAERTPCYNCKHVVMAGQYPCNCCSRMKEDMYESI